MLKAKPLGAMAVLALLAFAPSVNAQTKDDAFRRDIGKLLEVTGAVTDTTGKAACILRSEGSLR